MRLDSEPVQIGRTIVRSEIKSDNEKKKGTIPGSEKRLYLPAGYYDQSTKITRPTVTNCRLSPWRVGRVRIVEAVFA